MIGLVGGLFLYDTGFIINTDGDDGKRTTGAIATTSTKGAGRIPLLLHAPLRRDLDGWMD